MGGDLMEEKNEVKEFLDLIRAANHKINLPCSFEIFLLLEIKYHVFLKDNNIYKLIKTGDNVAIDGNNLLIDLSNKYLKINNDYVTLNYIDGSYVQVEDTDRLYYRASTYTTITEGFENKLFSHGIPCEENQIPHN